MSLVNSSFIETDVDLHSAEVAQLRANVKGRVITPEEPAYDEARQHLNLLVVARPALIVRALDAVDVSRVVSLARETGMELAIRGGGHSLAGHSTSEGGIVLDLSQMKGLEIDVEARTAWAEAGLTAGEFSAATAEFGLATGFGDTASVGIGGLTTGGGIGYLTRKYGMTIDNLLAAKVVTADGMIRYVDAETNADLFWAIRGGGGNFGVVTHFKFQLHPVDTVIGGILMLPATPELIAKFAALSEAAPDELSSIVTVMLAPPLPFVPAEQVGQLVMMATMVYAGDLEEGARVVAPFRALAQPIVDMIGPMPYPQIMRQDDPEVHPATALRSKFIEVIDERTARIMIDKITASTAMITVAEFRVLGGAMARIPADATAFAHRSSRVMLSLMALYMNPAEAAVHNAWVIDAIAALEQGSSASYVNFVGDEGKQRVNDAYPAATRERLAAIKAKYDPTNLFRRNHNIAPKA